MPHPSIRHALLYSALLLTAAGCDSVPSRGARQAVVPSPTPRPEAPLVVAVVGDPVTFNPIAAENRSGRSVCGAVFDTLVRLDPQTAQPRPNLATDWQFDADESAYTMHLRDDVRWHDGRPFTARDVVFTFEAIHAAGDGPYANILRVDGKPVVATAVGTHIVRFDLPRPHAPFLQSLVVPILPAHRFDGVEPERVAAAWGVDTNPAEIIGSGPFRIERYQPQSEVVLRHHPEYWRYADDGSRLPYLDRYVVRIAASRDVARKWFLEGGIHIFNPTFDEVAEVRNGGAAHAIVVEEIGPDTGSMFLTFNRNPLHYRKGGNTDPRFQWFNDRRFLAAIAHSIDKRRIIDEVLHGMGESAWSILPPANPFCGPSSSDYEFDPELARQILFDAGYRDRNGDGVLEDAGGKPIEFSLVTNEDNPVRARIARIVIAQLAELGMRVSLEPVPFPTLFERLDATYEWDAMLIGFTGGIDPVSNDNILRSSGELHLWHPAQQRPETAWEAEVDRLLDLGIRELDAQRRREIYDDVQRILHAQLPMIHLVRPTLFAARRAEVENFRPSSWGFDQIEELRLRQVAPPGGGNAADIAG